MHGQRNGRWRPFEGPVVGLGRAMSPREKVLLESVYSKGENEFPPEVFFGIQHHAAQRS
jgi:hypothetical protein